MFEAGSQVYKKYNEGDVVTYRNSLWVASSNVRIGKTPTEGNSGWTRSQSGDITGIAITADAGLTGTMKTTNGFHFQDITIATGGITTAHIADNAITSSKIADGAILGVDVANGVTLTNPDITGDAEVFGNVYITATAGAGGNLLQMLDPTLTISGTNRTVAIHIKDGGISADVPSRTSTFANVRIGDTSDAVGNNSLVVFGGISANNNIRGGTGMFNYLQANSGITAKGISTDNIHVKSGISAGGLVKGNTGDFNEVVAVSGISCGGNITVRNAGDVSLNLIADTDNSGEDDNPIISMGQDGAEARFNLGIVGNAGQIFTNSVSNAAFLDTANSFNDLQFAVAGDMKMTILDGGNIGIGTNAPGSSLDVVGNISASNGISANSSIVSGYTGEFTDIISVNGLSAHGGLVKGKTGEFNEVVAIGGLSANQIRLGGDIVHIGDSDTRIQFTTNVIDMQAGTQDPSVRIEAGPKVTLGDPPDANNGTQLIVDDNAEKVTINAVNGLEVGQGSIVANNIEVDGILNVSNKIRHKDDTDTLLDFRTNELIFTVGGVTLAHGTGGILQVPVGISAQSSLVQGYTGEFTDIISVNGLSAHGGLVKGKTGEFNEVVAISGISSGGDIECSGSIILAEDGFIGVASDDERIIFDGTGNDVTLKTANVFIDRKLLHNGDGDTFLEFKPDIVSLEAGGNKGFAYNGVTFDYADTVVTRPELRDYSETVNAIGSVNSNTAVDFESGNVQTVTIAGNCEFSFSNPPASGKAGTVTLIITNGGSATVTYHSSVKWPSDVAPSLTSSGIDIITFLTTDAGSNIYGFVGGLNFS